MTTEADWDRIVKDWGTREGVEGQREHTALAARQDPVPPETPVDGCECARCATYRVGGDTEDADVAAWLVERLAKLHPANRWPRAHGAYEAWTVEEIGCRLPKPATLVALAGEVPGARQAHTKRSGKRLPVEEARCVNLLELIRGLGLGEPKQVGREYHLRCPFHDDSNPSLRLNPEKGVWYCDPCADGGDGIELYMRVTGDSFREAVQAMTRGVAA